MNIRERIKTYFAGVGCCALVCFLAGGIIGIGTLATTFGFGPVIHFFNKHFSEKVIRKAAEN